MLKSTKIILITASALLVGGMGITGAAYAFSGFDPHIFTLRSKSAESYERKTAAVDQDFRNIKVDCKTEDIKFLPSPDGKISVEYSDCDKLKHNVNVNGDVLTITAEDDRSFPNFFVFNVSLGNETSDKIYKPVYVYLPDGKEYGDISVRFSTGDIENGTKLVSDSMTVFTTTGDIELRDLESKTLDIGANTGDIKLENIKADTIKTTLTTGDTTIRNAETGKADFGTVTGEINLSSFGKGDLSIKYTTGSVDLKDVEAKTAIISGTTGDIELDGFKADDCVIDLTTGCVSGSVIGDYQYTTKINTGDIEVPGSAGEAKMQITVKTGDIEISKR